MEKASNNNQEGHYVAHIPQNHETICWGCGLRLMLPSFSPVFKCGWCGAITNQNPLKHDSGCCSFWRRVRDRSFLTILVVFMLLVICGGVWAAFPFVFALGYMWVALHSSLTVFFATGTMYSFILAAFRHAGEQASVLYGSYEVVRKDGLHNYRFCHYCQKPKSPRTHHCRSCKTCILDMDHHCPFIGNCVGAGNHRLFVIFLAFAVISNFYALLMSVYVGWHVWPPLMYDPGYSLEELSRSSIGRFLAEILHALANTALLLSARGIVLIYLCIASASVEVGIGLLLWQQLQFIYEGKTYMDHLSSWDGEVGESGWHNVSVFFGCPYPVSVLRIFGSSHAGKSHKR
ncbi:unnamed protein product [Victoria cruziana]